MELESAEPCQSIVVIVIVVVTVHWTTSAVRCLFETEDYSACPPPKAACEIDMRPFAHAPDDLASR